MALWIRAKRTARMAALAEDGERPAKMPRIERKTLDIILTHSRVAPRLSSEDKVRSTERRCVMTSRSMQPVSLADWINKLNLSRHVAHETTSVGLPPEFQFMDMGRPKQLRMWHLGDGTKGLVLADVAALLGVSKQTHFALGLYVRGHDIFKAVYHTKTRETADVLTASGLLKFLKGKGTGLNEIAFAWTCRYLRLHVLPLVAATLGGSGKPQC